MCRPPWISAASLLTKALLSLKKGTIWTSSGNKKTLAVLTWIVKKYSLYLVNMGIIVLLPVWKKELHYQMSVEDSFVYYLNLLSVV